jgi:hypothetical protein
MAIVAGDLEYHFSGATGTPITSLGGAIHANTVTDASLHNLFDVVSSDEATAGDTEYRCIYLKNAHGTLTLQGATVYIVADTANSETQMAIALGTSAIDGTEQTVGDEDTAPAGVTWETGIGSANELTIGDLAAGSHKALWIRRVVSAAASAANDTDASIRFGGDTAA